MLSVRASGENVELVHDSVEVFCYFLNEFSYAFEEQQTKFLTEFINYVVYANSSVTAGYFVDATKGFRSW